MSSPNQLSPNIFYAHVATVALLLLLFVLMGCGTIVAAVKKPRGQTVTLAPLSTYMVGCGPVDDPENLLFRMVWSTPPEGASIVLGYDPDEVVCGAINMGETL